VRRRRLIPVLLSLGILPATVILPTVAPPSTAPRPVAPTVTSIPVPGVDQAAWVALGSPRGVLAVTAPLSTRPFTLVGLTWPRGVAPAGMDVSVRVREAGRWTGWQALDTVDVADSGGTGRGRAGTEPLLTGGRGDGVQVRVDAGVGAPGGVRTPPGMRLELIDPGSSPADASLGRVPAATASAATSQPQIITRAQWGADESLRNGSPSYSPTIKVGFVHHTVTSNTYSRDGAAAQIRAIYAYDTNGLGWSDIGYNFLVDRFGRIYEGRAGGITKAVIGAHTAGFNNESFAVAALGCFDSSCSSKLGGPATPPAAMVDSIAAVMGWKLALFGRDPKGTAWLTSSGLGASNTQYPKGETVRTAVVSGHRDNNATACPGSTLYPLVHTTIRDKAAAYAATVSSDPVLSTPTVSPTAATWGHVLYTLTAQVSAPTTWTLRVTAPGSATPVRTVTGSATSTIDATWDGTRDDGTSAPPGPYRMTVSTGSAGQDGQSWGKVVEILTATGAPTPPSRRLGGSDRYATAVAMAGDAYPSSRTVVLVSGEATHLVDGLVAAPLARAAGGPVLVTKADSLPAATSAEITRRHATRAFVVGGSGAVSGSVVDALRQLGVTSVRRVAGADRYATASAVAAELLRLRQAADTTVDGVLIASGEQAHLIDAAAAGGPAAATGRPILLATRTGLPAATRQALAQLRPSHADVLGTTDVLSQTVVDQLVAAAPRVGTPRRLGGADRYATAAAIASGYADRLPGGSVAVAAGADSNLVDSLAGGAMGRLTLLTASSTLSQPSGTWLRGHDVGGVLILGSRGVVSSNLFWAAATAAAG
jgi:putative cell wall-binding protein